PLTYRAYKLLYYSLTFVCLLALCLFELTRLLLCETTLFSLVIGLSLVSSILLCFSAFSVVVGDCIRCLGIVLATGGFCVEVLGYLLTVLFSPQSVFVTEHELFSTQASVAIHVRSGFPGIFLSLFIFFVC